MDKEQSKANETIVYINSLQDYSDLSRAVFEPLVKFSSNTERVMLVKQLIECPLLENLHAFLNWNDSLGGLNSLKELLIDLNEQKLNLETILPGHKTEIFHIDVLETQPGTLLKITNQTDIELLKEAVEEANPVDACGHLVSLIALKYKASVPISLIANEIESSLAVCLNKYNTGAFYQFLIDWILRVPLQLAIQVIFKFIIGPAAKIENDNQIKASLFKYLVAKGNNRSKELKEFVRVGELCSISEWSLKNAELLNKAELEEITTGKFKDNNSKEVQIKSALDLEVRGEIVGVHEQREASLKSLVNEVMITDEDGGEGDEFKHVASIRKRYGVGIELDEESRSVADSLKGVIGRSLESLSNELYNKEMHFVLELIQNADDNEYGRLGRELEPTLVFLVEDETISLFNNEVGFDRRNVSAVCDVKASTKGKHQRGYIGRKGNYTLSVGIH